MAFNFKTFLFFLFMTVTLLISGSVAFASITDGTVTGVAWSENIGWINFGASGGNMHVTDFALTGAVWNKYFGWIKLNPTNGGVINDAVGNLSGTAWGSNIGWINFSGVTINSSGLFTGTATGVNTGDINFSCTNCNVTTDWRPASLRGGDGGGGGGGGGGGSLPSTPPTPVTPPDPPVIPVTPTPPTPPTPPDPPVIPTTPIPPAPPTPVISPATPAAPTSSAPSNSVILPIIELVIPTIIIDKAEQQIENVKVIAKEISKIVSTPEGAVATKVVSTTGIVAVTASSAANIAVSLPSMVDLFSLPIRLLSLLLTAFGIKKRVLPWGTVYDSATKQPLDPVRVTLKNLEGKEIASAITDLDGRYGFLVDKGEYYIEASKSNYIFPSKNLANRTQDEIYKDLYFGAKIVIGENRDPIVKNIPLDPVNFNWNEFTKKNQKLNRFWSKWDFIVRIISDIFFTVGFFVAIIAYFVAPYPYNTVIMFLYVFLAVLILFGIKPKALGCIIDKNTGYPIPYAIIRVLIPPYNIEFNHKVADVRGRYFCLTPKGEYYIKVEKKNEDGSYSLVYTSPIKNGSKEGIVREKFKV